MKTINHSAVKIENRVNQMLEKCGMPVGLQVNEYAKVGCKWCEYSLSFYVVLPKIAAPVISKVIETFKNAGFGEVGSCEDGIDDRYVIIDASA